SFPTRRSSDLLRTRVGRDTALQVVAPKMKYRALRCLPIPLSVGDLIQRHLLVAKRRYRLPAFLMHKGMNVSKNLCSSWCNLFVLSCVSHLISGTPDFA